MTNLTLHIPNISCDHCVHTVQTEVGELAGVASVKADRDSKNVTIVFDSPATQSAIEAKLEEIDYPAEKLLAL
jgi:copper ion binding protein